MNSNLLKATLTAAMVMGGVHEAKADHVGSSELVDSWYHRYLGRHLDPVGRHDHVSALRHGAPVDVVEASILGSQEYWQRNGWNEAGFIRALYRDVAGRGVYAQEMTYWFARLQSLAGNRQAMALEFLRQVRVAPVTVDYRPAVVTVPAYRPVYVTPPPIVTPRPSFGIDVRFGR